MFGKVKRGQQTYGPVEAVVAMLSSRILEFLISKGSRITIVGSNNFPKNEWAQLTIKYQQLGHVGREDFPRYQYALISIPLHLLETTE